VYKNDLECDLVISNNNYRCSLTLSMKYFSFIVQFYQLIFIELIQHVGTWPSLWW